jgi:hypothetical protein
LHQVLAKSGQVEEDLAMLFPRLNGILTAGDI